MKPIVRSARLTRYLWERLILTAGLVYCAVATLSCLGEIDENLPLDKALPDSQGISLERCVRWMTARQTLDIEDDNEDSIDLIEENAKQQSVSARIQFSSV